MAATPVRYYDSTFRGLGGIDGTPGSFIALFDKIGITGFGDLTVQSLVVVDGVATATFTTNESFDLRATLRLAGVTDMIALNGDHQLKATGTNWVSWNTAAANGTASGSMTMKVAPLGYIKPVSGTNKAGYQSASSDANKCIINIDDTYSTYLKIAVYETMSDVNTGLGRIPTVDRVSEWAKSGGANTTKYPFYIVGDDKGFYYGTCVYNVNFGSNYSFCSYYVGEFADELPIKRFNFVLVSDANITHPGRAVNNAIATRMENMAGNHDVNVVNIKMQRDQTFYGFGANARLLSTAGAVVSSLVTYAPTLPNPVNNRIYIAEAYLSEWTANTRRGMMPGIYSLIHADKGPLTTGIIIDNVETLPNRKLMFVGMGTYGYSVNGPGVLFDITGPWR